MDSPGRSRRGGAGEKASPRWNRGLRSSREKKNFTAPFPRKDMTSSDVKYVERDAVNTEPFVVLVRTSIACLECGVWNKKGNKTFRKQLKK